MEWFYQHGLKVLGWTVVTAVSTATAKQNDFDVQYNEPVQATEITTVIPQVSDSELLDAIHGVGMYNPITFNSTHSRINPKLDFTKNPDGIPTDFLLFYLNPKLGVPDYYVKNTDGHGAAERLITQRKLKRFDTERYSLVVDGPHQVQYYKDGVTHYWAASELPFKLNKRKERAEPTQVGNSLYIYDYEGTPWITFDGRIWAKCHHIAPRRLEWLLEYGDPKQIFDEAIGERHATKHHKRAGKKRGTRSRKA